MPSRPHFLTQPPPSPDLIAVGPWDRGEFAALRQSLDPTGRWQTLPTLEAAIANITANSLPPELLLLAQLRPTGAAEQASIERLRILAPLTRTIVVAGSWCEGELRTGRPLTGVVRLYWYEFASWWQAALTRIASSAAPPWSEPLDDVRAGQLTRRLRLTNWSQTLPELAGQRIAIDSVDYATYESLSDALSPLDCQCLWQPRLRPELFVKEPALGIFDGGQLEPGELEHLRRFAVRLNADQAPVVLLLDFPRREYMAIARQAGAAAIVAKPYQVDLLVRELLLLIETSPTPHREAAAP